MKVSNRMRNALIADLVESESDPAAAEAIIREPLEDEHEVTGHIGRQLGIGVWRADASGGIRATLMTLVPELERLLREWPLPEDGRQADTLASLACRDLSDYEVYATLLTGPAKWRGRTVPVSSIEKLPEHLRPILLRGFASSLNEMLERWKKWNVPGLYKRWMKEKDEREEREIAAAREARQGITPEERQRKREDARKWRERAWTTRRPG